MCVKKKKKKKTGNYSNPKERRAGGKKVGARGRGKDGEVAAECGGKGEEMRRH